MCAQSCLTLCDPVVCSQSGSPVLGIFQAGILEWVAMPFSRGSSPPKDQTCISVSPALAGKFFTTVPRGKPSVHFGYEKLTLCLSTCLYLHLTLLPLCVCVCVCVCVSDDVWKGFPNALLKPWFSNFETISWWNIMLCVCCSSELVGQEDKGRRKWFCSCLKGST